MAFEGLTIASEVKAISLSGGVAAVQQG